MKHVVAISGGKDSVAMALRLAEVEPREYVYLITPTGNELPEMVEHWTRLEKMLGKPFIRLQNFTLAYWINHFYALPNWRMRWCTRLLKIEPCLAWIRANQPATMYVGLRADEEERQGIYSNDVITDFPMRRWGWGIKEVWEYLRDKGITIPERTDCAWCYDQRVGEWQSLWRKHPDLYEQAVQLESEIGQTFRSGARDTWPASLAELRKEFEAGRKTREDKQRELIQIQSAQGAFWEPEVDAEELVRCRVCRL